MIERRIFEVYDSSAELQFPNQSSGFLPVSNITSMPSPPYHRVQVEVMHGQDGSPQALVVTMLRARIYTADILEVKVDAEYNVLQILTARSQSRARVERVGEVASFGNASFIRKS